MGKIEIILVLLIVVGYGVLGTAIGFERGGEEEEGKEWWKEKTEEEEEKEFERKPWFVLEEMKHIVKTEAGEMSVVRGPTSRIIDRPMHIGFITMEPKSLFAPQYMDSTLILFIRTGEVKLGLIYKDELAERRMKSGDVYRIPAGSVFYLVNIGEGQRLEIICSIDRAQSTGLGTVQSFFIAGGSYPGSVLAGFDHDTLATAFNISRAELKTILTKQSKGPIMFVTESESPSVWTKLLQVKNEEMLKKTEDFNEEEEDDDEKKKKNKTWSWRKLLVSIFGDENRESKEKKTGKSPDSYNLYDAKPDFENGYGSSIALDEKEYPPLGDSGIGVYSVKLSAGAMMAPHANSLAAEIGIVLRGNGTIQIVFPNGTSAMNAEVSEGNVFWIPKYFPFCQIASRTGPFEFFGFTTSSRNNRPQFFVGENSILHALRSPELATALGLTEEELDRFINAQVEKMILPSAEVAPPYKEEEKQRKEEEERERGRDWRMGEVMESLGKNMVMGFD